MLTRRLSETLKHLHITLNDFVDDFDLRLPRKDQLVPMKELQTFTLIKSYSWKLKNELILIDLLTNAAIMPMLRQINLSITLNINELYCLKQCSIFNDYRCIDVHFVLYIDVFDPTFQLKDLIPHGSLSYPRKIMGSMLMFNYWYDIGYSTSIRLNQRSPYKFDCRWMWYTLPWSFEKFFQKPIIHEYNHKRKLYTLPSSSNIIIPPNILTLNEQVNISSLPKFYPFGSKVLQNNNNNQSSYYHTDTTILITIPADRIIVIDCLERITNFIYTSDLRSIHIILNFSQTFTTINWKLLRVFSFLPLLKSFRITICNFESILEDEHCQLIAERVPKLTDFVFCFRRDSGPIDDHNDQFNIHQKSILNLYHHISILIRDQQHKILIETDGCGLMIWL
ncbi:unnamed protein product [Adineta steineri]|uniref:Uncharacterized protein n=1 Tax=Adineta steineri TaxID=433720 RepID=A0A819YJL8_9BILA|nr:unnamed protein product [Adineta steineri]